MKHQDFLLELETAIKKNGRDVPKERATKLKSYINTQYDVSGLTVPFIRSYLKKGILYPNYDLNEQLNFWHYAYINSSLYEIKLLALLFVEANFKKLDHSHIWVTTKEWVKHIDNWAHSDGLSDIYTKLLHHNEKEVYQQLSAWNKSTSQWERRQSVVSLLYYSSKKTKLLPYNKLISLVKPLLKDEAYYVQKGVGWCLREIGNVYPKEQRVFVKEHLLKLSSVAFTTAIEKYDPKEKEPLKLLRKQHRTNNK